ncbi:MAG: hypothetical protein JO053_13865, partial [Acidobacteria bacterium]|nr:hypothetical protein [Acidobacteriota bacterium]
VTDEGSHPIPFDRNGDAGWKLASPHKGSIHLRYRVDLSALAAANWPAPREAAFGDSSHFIFVGRSTFITSAAIRKTRVAFSLPSGWHAEAPWQRSGQAFETGSAPDLVENLIVLTSEKTESLKAGFFSVAVTPLGRWRDARADVFAILKGVIPKYVALFGARSPEEYSIVLLPQLDHGGEAYRASFAYNYENVPTSANRLEWGHTIAHEIFHYWNGYRLAGADYPSSQWFQEGFTDYMADVAMASAGLENERQFLERIDYQMDRYSRLTTPLAQPGTHKGPPLYGGGSLVALCWDIQIRHTTGGKRSIRDLWPLLWRRTNSGTKPYTWDDIRAALTELAPLDWNAFYLRYVDGSEKLPLDDTLRLAGLTIVTAPNGIRHVAIDPEANEPRVRLRKQLVSGK